jgi:hypothetical protein
MPAPEGRPVYENPFHQTIAFLREFWRYSYTNPLWVLMIYCRFGGTIQSPHLSEEHTRMTVTGNVIWSKKSIEGFSLIEVMISLLIFFPLGLVA